VATKAKGGKEREKLPFLVFASLPIINSTFAWRIRGGKKKKGVCRRLFQNEGERKEGKNEGKNSRTIAKKTEKREWARLPSWGGGSKKKVKEKRKGRRGGGGKKGKKRFHK